MATIVNSLNEEWATLACSPKARRALMRWTARYPELGQVQSLDEFVNTRGRPEWAATALRVLAIEAPDDEVAARTLLQSLLGGVVRVVQGIEARGEQLYCLADTARLVDGALLADRQMHRQMQERVGPALDLVAHAAKSGVDVGRRDGSGALRGGDARRE